jgi:large subunit ribosomal protein L21
MYAIIRAGGKQAKVSEGDVIAIERIKSADAEVTFTPLLVVQDDGTVISERDALGKTKVVAEVLGESRGDKVEVFKYKNKTGYRRRQGHRQTYTTIQVTAIETGAKAEKKSEKKSDEKSEKKSDEKSEKKSDEKSEKKSDEKSEKKAEKKSDEKAETKTKEKASSEEKAPKKAAKAPKDKDEAATDPKAEAPAAETAAGDEEA